MSVQFAVDAGDMVCVYYSAHGGKPLAVHEDTAGTPAYEKQLDHERGPNGWFKECFPRAHIPWQVVGQDAQGNAIRGAHMDAFHVHHDGAGNKTVRAYGAQAAQAAAVPQVIDKSQLKGLLREVLDELAQERRAGGRT